MTPPPSSHEFSATENAAIDAAVKPMRLAAIAWPVLGLAGLASAFIKADYLLIPSAVLFIGLGASLFLATRSLNSVTTTEGDDINHMMSAIRSTAQYFFLICVVFGIILFLDLNDLRLLFNS
jgi:hypothetical protein